MDGSVLFHIDVLAPLTDPPQVLLPPHSFRMLIILLSLLQVQSRLVCLGTSNAKPIRSVLLIPSELMTSFYFDG
jgi:hypothetical protein